MGSEAHHRMMDFVIVQVGELLAGILAAAGFIKVVIYLAIHA